MPDYPLPSLPQVEQFLTTYGWNYRKAQAGEPPQDVLISPFALNQQQGIWINFHIQGEFLLVNTVGLLKNVTPDHSPRFLSLNDTIKLVKIYALPSLEDSANLDLDLSFELWAESLNQDTFSAFMDMLCLGIQKTLEYVNQEQILHQTQFVSFSPPSSSPPDSSSPPTPPPPPSPTESSHT